MQVPYLNMRLIGEPLNWAVVGVTATLWLILFHFFVVGFSGLKAGNKGASRQAPGQSPAGPAPGPQGLYSGTYPTS